MFGTPHLESALVTILGFVLLSLSYLSFGMFISSLTENQVISAIVSIGFFLLIWFLPGIVSSFSSLSLMNAFYNSFMIMS